MTVNPLDNEDLYDSIVLGAAKSPGKAKLGGFERVVGWDVQKAKGKKGASMTRTSEDPVEFTVSFFLADREDFAAWPAFLAVIDSTVADPNKPKPLDIYHPDLAELKVKSVVKRGLTVTTHDGKGGQTKTVKFLEYFPPAPAGGSASGASSKATSPAKPDPNADLKAELDRLTQEYLRPPGTTVNQEYMPR